jgi:hypothetical protein
LVEDSQYELSKRVWSFAHYSRYIRPGAYRVGVDGGEDVLPSAYVNKDGSTVVVVLNPLEEARTLEVVLGQGGDDVHAWVTDQELDMAELEVSWNQETGTARIEVPARGLVTLKTAASRDGWADAWTDA